MRHRSAPFPTGDVCEVEHDGTACGRSNEDTRMFRVVIDGSSITLCWAHRDRHHAGKTGDDFTTPIGKKRK